MRFFSIVLAVVVASLLAGCPCTSSEKVAAAGARASAENERALQAALDARHLVVVHPTYVPPDATFEGEQPTGQSGLPMATVHAGAETFLAIVGHGTSSDAGPTFVRTPDGKLHALVVVPRVVDEESFRQCGCVASGGGAPPAEVRWALRLRDADEWAAAPVELTVDTIVVSARGTVDSNQCQLP